MTRRVLSGRLGLVLAVLLLAVAPAAAEPLRHGPLRHGQGIFWRIEGKGAEPSHILGTFHTADQRVLDLAAEIGEAFKAARSLSLERVMTYEDRVQVNDAMTLSGGRNLRQILGKKLFNDVVLAARAYRLPPSHVQTLKPWAVYMVLGMPPGESIRRGMGAPFLDYMLQQAADQMGKPVHGLEQVDQALGFFDELSQDQQIALVEAALRFNYHIDNHFYKAMRYYLRADMDAVLTYFGKHSTLDDPGLAEILQTRFIDDRNAVMVKNMLERLRKGRAFVAVGAAHLPGEKGVLHLLEQRGYRVARVF